MNKIKVSELFYSLQGEGHSRGEPFVFIRLPNCNLNCHGENWKCDSEALRTRQVSYDVSELWEEVLKLDINLSTFLNNRTAGIIFTGGEPGMINNSRMINEFIAAAPFPFRCEVETNGSVELSTEYVTLLETVDIINCSPKLESSGNPFKDRYTLPTLRQIASYANAYFKFVISNAKDITEIEQNFSFVRDERIILMPATWNNVDDEPNSKSLQQFVWNMVLSKGWRFSSREHIEVWGLQSGV